MFLPLHFALRASRVGMAVQLLTHGLAAWAVWPSAAPLALCLLLDATVGLSLAYQITRGVPLAALKISKTVLHVRKAGEWTEASVRGAYVSPLLVVLRLDAHGSRVNLVLWPDSAGAEDLRRLRVWLGWRRQGSRAQGS